MPWGLKRYYGTGGLHFITCSCYRRQPILGTSERRDLFLSVLENMRQRYHFVVVGYVVMPEHFHLLMSEPEVGTPSVVMQAVKLGFARRLIARSGEKPHFSRKERARNGAPESGRLQASSRMVGLHIWQRRFYDFNLWSQKKEAEKLHYMHQNPMERGLVEHPEDWNWSSFRAYALGEVGAVRVNDWSRWEERIQSKVS
jgi:putative transposase